MAEKEDKSDKAMEEAIKKVGENPQYKVLTREEYEALMKGAIPKTSTPRVPLPPQTPKTLFGARTPGLAPGSRLQQLLNISGANQSIAVPSYNPPKLPFFSGSDEPAKGETSYEVWSHEVKCLQNSEYIPEHVLLNSVHSSLRGAARELLIPLGENASVKEVLEKLDGFYGNVSTAETIIQSFYSDYQKENESVAAYGSRLEQTLSRAIRCGHMELEAKDSMLRSKFWTGLKSQQLRNSTRYLYDTKKDFQSLLREIRKVEQEESCSTRPDPPKQKVAQQQYGQVPTDHSDSTKELQKQMSELMNMVKSLEHRMESQQQTFVASNNQPSFQQDFSSQQHRGRGRGYRGQSHGSFARRNAGRGYANNDYNNSNQGSFRGGRFRSSSRGGTDGRGATRGGSSNGRGQSLN